MGGQEVEEQPTWKEIMFDYSQDTTMHGVRYITVGGRRQCFRRFLWVLLVLAATCCFLYLFISRLQYFFTWPKSVNVDVTYSDKLDFPAVTVCNQNQFRLSKIHEQGLYDLFRRNYTSGSMATGVDQGVPTDVYEFVRTGCLNRNYSVANMVFYHEVTLVGCQYICGTKQYDQTCGVVLFLPLNRSCYVQPVLPLEENGPDCDVTEIYRRKRNENADFKMMCDFDGSNCSLIQEELSDDVDFREVSASVVGTDNTDHTTETGRGRLLYLPETVGPRDFKAEMYTTYSKTNGKCVELFYAINGYGYANLTVSYRGEDFISKALVNVTGRTLFWARLFARLPDGFNQVVIQGFKPADKYGGILLDSISIDDCKTYERDCMRFFRGQAYTGAATLPGCVDWKRVDISWHLKFPDKHVTLAGNKCRNPGGLSIEGFETPFCYVGKSNKFATCPMKYCDCMSGYKPCGDGRCLPLRLICDGKADCPDLKDETDHCKEKQKTTCQFEDQYLCGYNGSAIIKDGVFWTWQSDASTVWPDAKGGYLLADSGSKIDRQAYLISPFSDVSSASCLTFFYRVGEDGYAAGRLNTLVVKVTQIKDVLTGWRIWKNTRNKASDYAAVSVPPDLRGRIYFIFQGTIVSTSQMLAISDIKLETKACPASASSTPACKSGQFQCGSLCLPQMKLCDGTADCDDSSDETHSNCKAKTNVTCDFRNSFMCGYQTSATVAALEWSRQISAEFPLNHPKSVKTMMGYECVLPFDYGGTSETDCIDDRLHPGKPWCSLEKEYNPKVTQWDYCGSANATRDSACGQLFTSFDGNIISPGYPNDYQYSANCRYEVLLPADMYMEITVNFFDVDYAYCYDGYVLIPTEDVNNTEIALHDTFSWREINYTQLNYYKPDPDPGIDTFFQVCGKTPGKNIKFSTTGNRLRVFFLSGHQGTGFNIAYRGMNKPNDLDLIIATGIRADSLDELNPESISVLVSPQVHITKASCLTFDYTIVSNLSVLVYRLDGSRPTTLWTVGSYTGNTWSRAWVNLPVGKYHIMWKHRYGLDVKLRATTNRTFIHSAALDTIAVKDNVCDIIVKPSLDCNFDNLEQCGYMDKSVGKNYWTRIERGNVFYMVAKMYMDPQKVSNPARLQSRLTTVTLESCLSIRLIYFKICQFEIVLTDSQGASAIPVKSINANNGSNVTGVFIKTSGIIMAGTYLLIIDSFGQGDLYIEDISLTDAVDCQNAKDFNETVDMQKFEKWSVLRFLTEPLSQEYMASITYYRNEQAAMDFVNQANNNTEFQQTKPTGTTKVNGNQLLQPVFNPVNFSSGATTLPPQIHDYSKDPSYNVENIKYGIANFSNMRDFHWSTGHQLEDFIYRCDWDGEPCNKSKLSTQVTDSGLCVTFNGDRNGIYQTEKIGSGFGLSLMLNCEKYEYIRSPSTDVGIKVYLHHPSELPLVKELGSAVFPGVHAFVAAKYSKAESLGPPHGKCGDSSYKYYENVKYTRPHCEMECITTFVKERCDCKMAYMPGRDIPICNLTKYLDCVVPLVYGSGLQNPTCRKSCKDACNMNAYSAEISYAGFRTTSIGGILQSNSTKLPILNKQFLQARELATRVRANELQYTVAQLLTITSGMKVIRDTVQLKMEKELDDIAKAMKVFVQFVDEDMVEIQRQLFPYTQEFEKETGPKYRLLWQALDKISYTCAYFNVLFDFNDRVRNNFKVIMAADITVALEVSSHVDDTFSTQDRTASASISKKKGVVYKPSTYILPLHELLCKDLTLQSNLTNLEQSLSLDPSVGKAGIQNQCKVLSATIEMAKKCHNYYGDVLRFASMTLISNRQTLDRLKNRLDLVYKNVRDSFKEELSHVEGNRTYYIALAKKYTKFQIFKQELINKVDEAAIAKTMADIDSIISKLDERAYTKLKSKFTELHDTVKDVYGNTIEAITRLVPYFPKQWEDNARKLQIWLTPVAEVDTPSLLRNTILRSESWRVWPKSLSLLALNGSRDTKLADVVGKYITSLQDKLLEVENHLKDNVKVIKERGTSLIKSFSDYHTKIKFEENFLKENFVMMDVYFAVLKYESVLQSQAYGWLNFLSECGGYMGLLMGCSCLTICEVFDLVLHHCFLKRVSQRLQKKQVGDSEQVKKPLPDDDKAMTKVA